MGQRILMELCRSTAAVWASSPLSPVLSQFRVTSAIGDFVMEPGMINNPSNYPETIYIGTQTAYRKNYAFEYNMLKRDDGEAGVYICEQTTEYGLPHDIMFIVHHNGWWIACEGCTCDDGVTLQIRQPCFRTQENFWEADWHVWEMNVARHSKNYSELDGIVNGPRLANATWGGRLSCETKYTLD